MATAAATAAAAGEDGSSLSMVAGALATGVEWIEAQGDLGPPLYALFLGAWIMLLMPSSLAEIAPGAIFGWKVGFAVALVGKTLGSLGSLLMARLFLKGPLQSKLLTRFPRLNAIGQAVAEEGLPVLVILRLSYLPIVLKNYGLAVLDISTGQLVLAAIISGTPLAAMWTLIGVSAQDLRAVLSGEAVGVSSLLALLPEDPVKRTAVGAAALFLVLLLAYAVYRVVNALRARVAAIMARVDAKSGKKAGAAGAADGGGASYVGMAVRAIMAAAFVGLAAALWWNRASLPSLTQVMQDSVTWINESGPMGPVYYAIFLGLWVTALLPCSILEMVPGYLFGFRVGLAVSVAGKQIGTVLSLILGRFFLKDMIQSKILKRYPKLAALELAVKQEGFFVIIMIRCAYLPMLIKNYGLACLDIPLFDIWFASVFACTPFAAMWTAMGASATNLADIFEGKLAPRDLLGDLPWQAAAAGGIAVLGAAVAFLKFMRRFKVILAEVEREAEARKTQ
mmetsp:Transcript_12320/g.39429  ORF Transcript_12320/g.39429 Transcript_12320/m.39429 type:complete len:508 (+) Transcript_12320:85-1608(+)